MNPSHPKFLSILDYSYPLPDERIAQFPLQERDASKLLVYRGGKISESIFRDLPALLGEGTLLVFNDTRVVQARLEFHRPTGGRIEVFVTEGAGTELVRLMQQQNSCEIRALVGNLKKWKEEYLEREISVGGQNIRLRAENLGREFDLNRIRLSWYPGNFSFSEILEAAGQMPLPPYMKRDAATEDAERYQTVFARDEGSVAAPTAGLHFTDQLLEKLHEKGIRSRRVTLHVGAGTFKPVSSDTMAGHQMHSETIAVNISLVKEIVEQKKNILAVGTTSLRTVESLYWFGKKILQNPGKHFSSLEVSQWDPYEKTADVPAPVALRALHDWAVENNHETIEGSTSLLIAPGYTFRVADTLITNFHQPQSTLLLLVAAFTNGHYREIYEYALGHDFRFLSYGDACLLFR